MFYNDVLEEFKNVGHVYQFKVRTTKTIFDSFTRLLFFDFQLKSSTFLYPLFFLLSVHTAPQSTL